MINQIIRCITICITFLLPYSTLSAQTGSPWGVCAHAQKNPEWPMIDNELLKCQQAGIKWMRVDIQFSYVCATAGVMQFSRYDSLLLKCRQYGIQILPILQAFDSEITKPRPDMVPIYNHLPEWRAFVNAVVTRYHGDMKYWEIWNEQDGGFWKPSPNAAQYVPVLKAAYEEIKSIDTACAVIVGGLSGWNTDYLKNMYNAGAKGYFDKIAVHPYGYATDKSARIIRMRNDFYAEMKLRGDSGMPVWITESGGSSFVAPTIQKQPQFVVKAIRYALHKLGKDTTSFKVGIAVSPRVPNLDEVETWRSWLPGITLEPIPFSELATVDPAEFPVILGSESTTTDQPLLEPLRNYVINGGLMLAVNVLPFYYTGIQNPDGTWSNVSQTGITYPYFRLGFEAFWTKPGIPQSTTRIAVSPDALAGGVPALSNVLVDRFISPKNLQPGDTYYPIIHAYNSTDVNVGEAMSLFTYGDWQGGILMGTASLAGGYSESDQANLLQRVYLNYLSLGVEKIFWYDLHNDGNNAADKESNFGLLRWDFSPKPSYNAYKEMTGYLGSNPGFVKRLPTVDNDIWALAFRKQEDSSAVLAVWSADTAVTYNVLHRDSLIATYKGAKVRFIVLNDSIGAYKIGIPGNLRMDSIAWKQYGDADFALTAGSDNTLLPVTFSGGNPALTRVYRDSTANNQWKVKILGAGTDTITATQWDYNIYPSAEKIQRTLVISPALLTATPKDTSRIYGMPNPAFEIDYTGFVYDDDSTVITQRPVLTSTATLYSFPGQYPITAAGAAAANYSFIYNNGTLTVGESTNSTKGTPNVLTGVFLGSTTLMSNMFSTYAGTAFYQLVDLSGRRIFAQNVTLRKGINLFQFQVPNVARGIYIATVTTPRWRISVKIFK